MSLSIKGRRTFLAAGSAVAALVTFVLITGGRQPAEAQDGLLPMITVAPPAPPKASAGGGAGGPPTFTAAQVQRGKAAYAANCIDCHGPNLDDGEFGGAPLKGNTFDEHWGGGGLDALYLYMSTQMPPDRPGKLSDQTYADIAAFILDVNGYPSGGQELAANVDAMGKMVLKK